MVILLKTSKRKLVNRKKIRRQLNNKLLSSRSEKLPPMQMNKSNSSSRLKCNNNSCSNNKYSSSNSSNNNKNSSIINRNSSNRLTFNRKSSFQSKSLPDEGAAVAVSKPWAFLKKISKRSWKKLRRVRSGTSWTRLSGNSTTRPTPPGLGQKPSNARYRRWID